MNKPNRTHPQPLKQVGAESNKSKCHFILKSLLKASDAAQQPVSSNWHRYGFNTGNKAPILRKGAATPRRIFPSCIMEESGIPKSRRGRGGRAGVPEPSALHRSLMLFRINRKQKPWTARGRPTFFSSPLSFLTYWSGVCWLIKTWPLASGGAVSAAAGPGNARELIHGC